MLVETIDSAIGLETSAHEKFAGNEIKYVTAVLKKKDFHGISWAQAFEEAFCNRMDVNYSIACNSGTSALHIALAALGVQPGDEVICPALGVVMDAYAALYVNAVPVFADVNPHTFNIDVKDIEKKITKKTKAIIAVSLCGLPVDIDPIMLLAKKHNLKVLVDNAQTLLGEYKGELFAKQGDITIWSFESKKHLSCASEGGMVTTNDEALAIRARKFGGIGYRHLTATAGRTSLSLSVAQDPEYKRFDTVGYNYRMGEIAAAVGLAQLEQVDALVDRRIACAALFHEAVKECDWMIPQSVNDGNKHSYYTFGVQYCGSEMLGLPWKAFYDKYREKKGDGFYAACAPLYLEPALHLKEMGGYVLDNGLCPTAEKLQKRIMQFKTNYRDLAVAKQQAEILHDLITKLKGGSCTA